MFVSQPHATTARNDSSEKKLPTISRPARSQAANPHTYPSQPRVLLGGVGIELRKLTRNILGRHRANLIYRGLASMALETEIHIARFSAKRRDSALLSGPMRK